MPRFSLVLLIILNAFSELSHAEKNVLSFDAELSQFAYPFEVQSFSLATQNQALTMRYMDVGKKDADRVIVLLHGKNFSGYYWEKLAVDLVKQNYRVIIPDQIGFGKSSKPGYYQFSFSQLAYNTQALIHYLGITSYTVVGHSMGGMLAVNMAYLFDTAVNKLILINPIGLEAYLDYVEYKDPAFFFERELSKTIEGIRQYQQKNYYNGTWKEEYEVLLTPYKGWLNGPDWKKIAWNNALMYGPIFSEDMMPALKKVTQASYLIIGTRDTTGPGRGWKKAGVNYQLGQYSTLARQATSQVKNMRLFELNGLGHMPHIEDYEAFLKVFLPITQ